MAKFTTDRKARQEALSAIIRGMRLHRGMGVKEMADAMRMPVRSYQHFEAGLSLLNIDAMYAFAAATRSDPVALLAAVLLRAPELAFRSADNKLVSALLMNLEVFNESVGDGISLLRTNVIESAFRKAFDSLAEDTRQPDQTASWVAHHLRPHSPLDLNAPPDPDEPVFPDEPEEGFAMGLLIAIGRRLASGLLSKSLGLRGVVGLALTEDLVSIALATAAPFLLEGIIDGLAAGKRFTGVTMLAIVAFVLAWASPNLATTLKLVHTAQAVERFQQAITTAVLHQQLAKRYASFDEAAVNTLLERSPGALQTVFDGLVWRVAPLALQTLATLWALALALSPISMAILGITALAFLLAASGGAKRHQMKLDRLQTATLDASLELADITQHAERAVTNGTINQEVRRLELFGEARGFHSKSVAFALVGAAAIQFLILAVGLSLLLLLAARDVLTHRLSIGAFVMTQAFAFRLLLPLGGLVVSLRQSGPAFELLAATFALSGPLPYRPPLRQTALHALMGGLEVQDISFDYAGGPSGVSAISFTAKPGEMVAIVGVNGSGKSTLARVLAGRLKPHAGRVSIGGVDLSTLDAHELTGLVLFTPQDFSLFDRTLMETGCYPPCRLDEASLLARLHELKFEAKSRSVGMAATIGLNGSRLSGGQRQKLELARLAGTDAPLLILDEITSALDRVSDQKALGMLRRLLPKAIIVLVTHRRHHAQLADRVLHLDQGRLVGSAKDEELFAHSPSYRQIWERPDDSI